MSTVGGNSAGHGARNANIDHYDIEIGLDWGTFKWVAAYALSLQGEHVVTPSPLMISDVSHKVRMMATWDHQNRFIHGYELQGLANRDRNISDRIIDHFKLGLSDSPEVSSIRARNERILADIPGRDFNALITEHMRAVIADIKQSLRDSAELKLRFNEAQRDKLLDRLLVRITVPQMRVKVKNGRLSPDVRQWGPDARRAMQAAARGAGLQIAVLAREPLCALAYLVNRAADRFGKILKKGDVMAVMDLGSGTGDFGAFLLRELLTSSSRLDMTGHGSSGELCGSFRVDQNLYEAIKRREGRDWVVNSVSALQVAERDFERRALIAIEEIKQNFKETDDVCFGMIKGIGAAAVPISFTKEEIITALDEVIARIFSAMDKLVSKQTPSLIQVTGGFAKSWYLMKQIRERYSSERTVVVRPNDTDVGACFPVAVGSLLRYDNITMQTLPSQYGYALLQREVYLKDVHTESRDVSKTGKRTYQKPWVLGSPYQKNVDIVEDRILNIVPKGTVMKPGDHVLKFKRKLDYFVPVDNPRINDEFVYLDKTFHDHAASRDHEKEQRNLKPGEPQSAVKRIFRDGVHHWVSLDIALPEAQIQGFKKTRAADGKDYYELEARVVVRLVLEDMQIDFEILKPTKSGKRKAKKADDERMEVDSGDELLDDVAFVVRDRVWDGAHSDFAQA